jgi:hypothetical protein
MINFILRPFRWIFNYAVDRALGPVEDFEYTGSTTPDLPPLQFVDGKPYAEPLQEDPDGTRTEAT